MCEDALVAAAKQGQAEAFATLCQLTREGIIRDMRTASPDNHEDAEDALQDAFL